MNVRVVVSTNPDRSHWIRDFVESVPDGMLHVVDVCVTRNFETAAIRYGMNQGYEKFLFLQDSCLIKSPELFRHAAQYDTALLIPRPNCYLGVYHSRVLQQMWWPDIKPEDKEGSISNETRWVDSYCEVAKRTFNLKQVPVIYPELTDANALAANNIREVHGENRLHLENSYIVKRKGTYR